MDGNYAYRKLNILLQIFGMYECMDGWLDVGIYVYMKTFFPSERFLININKFPIS